MLTDLSIKNFTTIDALALELDTGLSIITGETGAGKSVLLDALALALGGKAPKNCLRDDARPAELAASFSLASASPATQWLQSRELLDGAQVLCRRVLKPDGRSRAFINGSPVSIGELRELAPLLVDLHGQHEHQALLNRSTHRTLLDGYGKHGALATEVAGLANDWSRLQQRVEQLLQGNSSAESRRQLLSYQVQELDKLAPQEGELEALQAEHKILANAENLLAQLQSLLQLCSGSEHGNGSADERGNSRAEGLSNTMQQLVARLAECSNALPALANALALAESASIQLEEAISDISATTDTVQLDPARLREVESRLDAIYTVARKHHVQASELQTLYANLQGELEELENGETLAAELREQQAALAARYAASAAELSRKRKTAARKLEKTVGTHLAALQMKHCQFKVSLTSRSDDKPVAAGTEAVEFLIATVPGKPAQPLAQVASGGELSRISLAIQVATAQTTTTPTLVFDEVDVGISGAVAEVVGNLLRELGKSNQVVCVTHLPQVAAKGSQHLLVTKQLSKRSANTSITKLDQKARHAEIARMLGGLDVTASTLAHAAEMLDTA